MRGLSRRSFLQGTAAAGASLLITGTRASGKIVGANNRLRIAVAGVNGRGKSHIGGWLEQDNVEIVYLIDPERNVLNRGLELVQQKSDGASQPKGSRRRPQSAGRSHARRDLGRHAQSLAFADHHLGLPGGKARLRRKTDEPRHRRGPLGRRGPEEVRRRRAARHAEPQQRADRRLARSHSGRQIRPTQDFLRVLLQAARGDRFQIPYQAAGKPRLEPVEGTGRGQRISTRTSSITTGTGSGRPATAT